nr:transframe fusion protein [Eastern equine encephalitis virus]
DDTLQVLNYLWNNNQNFFWMQTLIPLAALIVCMRMLRCLFCCGPAFLTCLRRLGRRSVRTHSSDAEQGGDPVQSFSRTPRLCTRSPTDTAG